LSARERHVVLLGGTSEPGGLHVHTADLALAVTAAGAKVTIACSSVDFFTPLLRGSPVRVVTIPPPGGGVRAAMQLRARLTALAATDIVLCHGSLGQSDPFILAAARSACRALYTVEHRPADGHISASFKRRLKGWLMSRLVRKTLAVSDEIQEQAIGAYGLSRDRIGVFPNWVDPSFHFVTRERRLAAKVALGLPGGITIGFHGRLAPEKRVDCLIAAFARLPQERRAETCLAIVGDGWKRHQLEALAAGLGVASEVRFLGWRPDPVEAVSAFDISVLPSLIEGFPLALMEAMAAGALCLAHPMPSTRELLGPDRGMLRDILSPQQLSDALAASLALPETARAAMGQRASTWVLSRHSRAERLGQLLAAIGLHPGDGPVWEIAPRQLEFPRP
jgi:glycosyltransferase involved in cell wall biosynthesis